MTYLLRGSLNGEFFSEDWLSYRGAIASRDRRLRDKTTRDPKSPTGTRTVIVTGWTAITIRRGYGG